jgi:hypothetical protein
MLGSVPLDRPTIGLQAQSRQRQVSGLSFFAPGQPSNKDGLGHDS